MSGRKVKLFADVVNGKPVCEMVPAEPIGPSRFRITASPGLVSGTANGDEIELLSEDDAKFRVIRRSGNIAIQLFLASCRHADRDYIVGLFGEIHGWLDGGARELNDPSGCLLIFTVPLATGFPAIEEVMEAICKRCNVDQWMYGNVYDTDGSTPLNWVNEG